jgi:hypothetical protein
MIVPEIKRTKEEVSKFAATEVNEVVQIIQNTPSLELVKLIKDWLKEAPIFAAWDVVSFLRQIKQKCV